VSLFPIILLQRTNECDINPRHMSARYNKKIYFSPHIRARNNIFPIILVKATTEIVTIPFIMVQETINLYLVSTIPMHLTKEIVFLSHHISKRNNQKCY